MSSKEKPTLGGTRIKTRKRNIAAPLDPAAFSDAVVQIYLDNAGDLELIAKSIESSDLNFSRYGDTFFEVVFTGGRTQPGTTKPDEGERHSYSIIDCEPKREAILPSVIYIQKILRRRPFLIKNLENVMRRFLQSLELFEENERKKLGIFTALAFSQKLSGLPPETVFQPLLKDNLVAKGLVLSFITDFFKEYLIDNSLDDLISILKRGKVEDNLLDFFPSARRSPESFSEHFTKEGLVALVEYNDKKIFEVKLREMKSALTAQLTEEAAIADVIETVKQRVKDAKLPDVEVVRILWDVIMDAVQWSGKNQQQNANAALRQVKAWAKLLSAFCTSGKLELELMYKVQMQCYEDAKLMKLFPELRFGQGSVGHGRDSRYWDRDDRRRDEDYNEDVVEHSSMDSIDEASDKGDVPVKMRNANKKSSLDDSIKGSDRRSIGLYNEDGRNELKMYEAQYEASLETVGRTSTESGSKDQLSDVEVLEKQDEVADVDDEYDDGFDFHDARKEDYDDIGHGKGDHLDVANSHNEHSRNSRESSDFLSVETKNRNVAEDVEKTSTNSYEKDSSLNLRDFDNVNTKSRYVGVIERQSTKPRTDSKRKAKRRKYSGSSCEMKFLNSTAHLVEPLESRKFARFTLQYTDVEEKPNGQEQWEPRFAGHQSLEERENSFLAHDQKINCGFVKGPKGSPSTGFDLAEDDVNYLSKCHIAVVSCIFGNSDRLRTPTGKTVTRLSRKNVCFVMFMDEVTLQTLSSEGHVPDRMGFIGLWKVVLVKNLPYSDMRRVGKIPKLLPHRLFPSARYSIWLDSKLRLQLDPLLILEYFLWRKGHEYAISNHYDRHCVWEEVVQNKKLNKYNHTIIDEQFAFYKADGLERYNASDPNKLLPSNVPEGSFIIRAHTPMSNLFSCLWFNEVDRFTPRDQLSFAYTYQKLRRKNTGKPFRLNMFKDCERRAIAKLFHHRSDERRNIRQSATE